MKNQCSEESCDTQEQSCSAPNEQECCPIEIAKEKWENAFCQALTEVKVELLKEKIKKAWGPQMDKAADAMVEAASVCWQSMLAKGGAKMKFKEALIKIYTEGKK